MKEHQTDAPVTTEIESAEPDVTLGRILKAGRETMGLSVQDAALKLHLRPKIVSDLESDNFTNIASPTYIRGYVKNYARMVNADSAVIEACLVRQVPVVTEPSMQSFSRKTTHQARDTKLKWLSFVIVFVLIGLLVMWGIQKSTELSHVDVSLPTVEEVAAANQSMADEKLLTDTDVSQRLTDIAATGSMATDGPIQDTDASTVAANAGIEGGYVDTAEGVQSNPIGHAQVNNPQANSAQVRQANSTPAANNTTPTTSAPQVAQPNVEPVIAGQSRIQIQLSGDCWINLVDSTGNVLVDGVRGADANVQVSGVPPFKVILGAPHVATLTLDGQVVSLADFPKGRVARLTLPKA